MSSLILWKHPLKLNIVFSILKALTISSFFHFSFWFVVNLKFNNLSTGAQAFWRDFFFFLSFFILNWYDLPETWLANEYIYLFWVYQLAITWICSMSNLDMLPFQSPFCFQKINRDCCIWRFWGNSILPRTLSIYSNVNKLKSHCALVSIIIDAIFI